MSRRLALRTHEEAGLSLSELLITMMIVSVVLVAATTALVATTRQFRVTTGKVDTQSDSRTTMESVTRDLRVVVPNPNGGGGIESGDATSVTVYTARDASESRPMKVSYSVDPSNQCLRRTAIKPTLTAGKATYPAASATSRCVGFGQVDTSRPVFTYWTIAPDGTTAPANLPANKDKVGSVEVRLQLTSPDRPEVNPTTVVRTVTLINQSNALQKG